MVLHTAGDRIFNLNSFFSSELGAMKPNSHLFLEISGVFFAEARKPEQPYQVVSKRHVLTKN